MIFTRSILSSAQTSGHRLTQPPITTPNPNTPTPFLSRTRTPYSVRALGVLIGLYWLTHIPATCTDLLVDFIFFWLAVWHCLGAGYRVKIIYLVQGGPAVDVYVQKLTGGRTAAKYQPTTTGNVINYFLKKGQNDLKGNFTTFTHWSMQYYCICENK